MDAIREEHLRGVADEGDYKKKIHALRWEVYVKEKGGLIKRYFSVSVPNPKWGSIVWTCVKYHIIYKRRTTNILEYVGLIINYLRKRRVGGIDRD